MSDGELKRPLSSPSGLLEEDLSSLSGLGALPDSACQEFLSVIFSWRSLSSLWPHHVDKTPSLGGVRKTLSKQKLIFFISKECSSVQLQSVLVFSTLWEFSDEFVLCASVKFCTICKEKSWKNWQAKRSLNSWGNREARITSSYDSQLHNDQTSRCSVRVFLIRNTLTNNPHWGTGVT